MSGPGLFIFRFFAPIVLSACVFLSAAPAWAGDERVYTLRECLDKTLEYSRDALIAGEAIKISEGRYIEERAAALPQVKAEAYALRASDDLRVISGMAAEGSEYFGNLNLTQALFTWGQIGAAIKAARYDKAASEQQFRAAQQLAMREAAVVFYDLLLTLELEKVARDNVAQKQRHFDEAQRRRQLEVATDYDVLSAQVAFANALPPLSQAENNIRLARDRLRYYMGIQGDFTIKGDLLVQPREPEPLEMVLARAKDKRPEVAFQNNRLGTFRELVTVAKAGNKPRLDFKSNVGWSNMTVIDQDSSLQHWDAGVYLSMPIFDGFQTKGRVMQAESRVSSSRYELDRLFDNIALDARGAINNVDESSQVVNALGATTSQAERLLQMAETGYRHGVKTKLEVDDAESNVLAARINLARARRDYITARIRLLWIMGEDLQAALFDPEISKLPIGSGG
ncbi:MAG: TolC family protein [Syntrophobacteraceae bacterium]